MAGRGQEERAGDQALGASPALVREVSFCRGQQLIQRLRAGQNAENKEPLSAQPWSRPPVHPPHDPENIVEKGAERV